MCCIKKLFTFIFFAIFISIGQIFANDNTLRLQALLNEAAKATNRVSATQHVIDLDAEGVSGTIDQTIYIKNGENIKFINGTLTSACSPMIEIDADSKLEVGDNVTIIGLGFGEAFHVNGGTLIASTGSTMNYKNPSAPMQNNSKNLKRIPTEPLSFNKLITLLNDGASFTLDGGIINGGLAVEENKVSVVIQSGSIESIQTTDSYGENATGKPSIKINGGNVGLIGNHYYGDFNANLYVYGGTVDYIGTYGSIRVSGTAEVKELIQMSAETDNTPKCQFMGGRLHQAQTSYNAWIYGNAQVDSLSLPNKDTYLMCWGDLTHDICLGVRGRVDGNVIAKGVSTLTAFREDFESTGAPSKFMKHQLTESDVEHIKAYSDEQYIDGTCVPSYNTSNWQWCHGYIQSATLKDNTVILTSNAQTNEAYAVYTDDGTLTFYYDNQKSLRTGTTYTIPIYSYVTPGWYNDHRTDIKKAVFTSSFSNARPTTTKWWFAIGYDDDKSNLSVIEGIEYLNTSNVTDMFKMFYRCSNLTSLDVSRFNTSNVTGMDAMFYGCSSLTSLDVSKFITSNVTGMSFMFYGCSGLTNIDLESFKTSNVTDMASMFSGCTNINTIYAGEEWNTDKVTSSSMMFYNCTNLVGGAGTVYDANHVDKEYARIDGGTSNPGYLTTKNATPSLNLQEFIDANAGATGVVTVDLSQFENDLVREQTLTVSTGASYCLINGTLTRGIDTSNMWPVGKNIPVMLISNGSKVAIGKEAVVSGGGYNATETIRLEGGTLHITEGIIEGSLGYPSYNYIGDPLQGIALKLTSSTDHLYLGNGIIYGPIVCEAVGADIQLDKGKIRGMGLRNSDEGSGQNSPRRASPSRSREPYISTYSDIYLNSTTSKNYTWGGIYGEIVGLNGEVIDNTKDCFKITLRGESVLHLMSEHKEGFRFNLGDKKDGDVIVVGDNYSITEEEVSKMSFEPIHYQTESGYVQRDSYLELKENKVFLRYKAAELPTTGCDEDWLQKKLDEIAEQKPSEPVELTICEDGITLTKGIMVKEDCKVILTGGPITSAEDINFRYGGEGLFMVYGEISLHDIILNFNNNAKASYNTGYFWLGGGSLNLLEGCEVSTVDGTVVGGWGKLNVKDASITAGGNEMMFDSRVDATISGCVHIIGPKTYCNGSLTLEMTNDPNTGSPRFPWFMVDEISVTSSLNIWAPYSTLRSVYLYKDATINTETAGLVSLPIKGEWNQMTVGRSIVTSSSIVADDYRSMTFSGMPSNRLAEFMPAEHAVKLVACGVQSFQSRLDQVRNLGANNVVSVDAGVTNMLYESTNTQGIQNVTFDGMAGGSASRGRLHFEQDKTLTVVSGSTLTLTNLDIDGAGGTDGIVVSGTLVLGGNVHVSDFTCFVQVQGSGRILATGSLTSPISIQFVNGAASGQVVVEGSGSYQLTEQDLAYVQVEGCELALDTANNRIVVVTGTGIETVSGSGRESAAEGIYDLNGLRVASLRHGVYIIRSKGNTRKVAIK